MRSKRPVTEAELDAYYGEPAPGEVWWCEGPRLLLPDGGKVRPVLVVSLTGDEARVIPLTSRRPDGVPIPVRHNGGLSWLTDAERTVPRLSLLSSLGRWDGFTAWRKL
jgi:hypothetical protein